MSEPDQYPNDANEGESEGGPEALLDRERDRDGGNDNRRWRYAVRELDAMDHTGAGIWHQIGPAPLQVGRHQVFQGPGPVSGEVVDIALDPRGGDTRTMYAAAGNGGLWKSTDGGTSWRPMTDQLPATAIGAVAIDPVNPDIVYIGSGNLFNGAAGMPKAAGLFKSVDGGRSWARLTSPAGRPPQPITAAANAAGGVRVTVAAHGYASLDRVTAVGLPGVTGAAGEGIARRIDDNTLQIGGVAMTAAYGGAGATLFDARQPPFLSDRGAVRMISPSGDTLLVGSEAGLYYSKDGGRNFGANFPDYNDGKPIRTGLISALETDQGWTRALRVADATPADPIVVTLPGHGFVTGDPVMLGGVTSNRAANGGWVADVIDADHISLRGSSGNGTGAVTGYAIGPAHPDTHPVTGATNPAAPAPIVITCAAHGFVTGDIVAVSGVEGNTGANGSWAIRVLSPDTFSLQGSRGTGAYMAGGAVDGPRHPAPRPVTAAVNAGGGVTVTIAGHGLINGDLVSVTGLPGIAAPGNSARVVVVDADRARLAGLVMNAPYGGAGAVVSGPADSWNTAYFAAAGRQFGTSTLNPDRGLYRLTVTSRGEVVISDNLMLHPGGPPPQHGRVAFCQARQPRIRTLYLSVQDDVTVAGNLHGFFVGGFRSDDFGGHWTPLPALTNIVNTDGGGQTRYDLIIAVDPQRSERVYAAQQQLWRSLTSGGTWPAVNPVTAGGVDQLPHGRSPSTTLLHWDHHELVFAPPTWWDWNGADPVLPTPAYHGTDGGIARSGGTAGGPMTFTQLNEGIATSLLTSLDIGRGAGHTEVTFAGMQDTGTAGHRTGDGTGVWTEGYDNDGGAVGVDPADPDIVFAFSNGNLLRSTNGGQTWFQANEAGGALVEIISVASTNPVQVTTAGHPFRTGDVVNITGVPGGGGLANGPATITVPANDTRTFTLNGKNGTAVVFGPFPVVTGDRYLAQRDIVAATLEAPIQIETATPHGCATGQTVRIDAVEGNTAANNTDARPVWTVTVISPTRLSLDKSDGTLSAPYVPHTGRLRGPAVNGPVPVFGTTNPTPPPNANPPPIVVTAQGHGFVTGGLVTITGVTGNTAANVVGHAITVLDANSFILNGIAGNGAPHGMPRARGGSVGRGLPVNAYIARVALVPNGGLPSTKIFVSMDRTLFRSTNGGITFVAMNNFTDFISALHAPADHRLWLGVSGLLNTNRVYRVRFSANDGASFDPGVTADVGARSFISQIIEDPRDATGQRVAVVCAGYSRTVTSRRTRHVFLTTTQGRAAGGAVPWHEVGGVFDAATGNLPDVPVMGAAWVPPPTPPAGPADPSDLLIATDSGVLRLDLAGPRWARVGPNLPKVGVQAIAADPGGAAPVIRIGTYGRSAWEFGVPAGPSLYVQADLGFGDQQVGTTVRLPMVLHSVGAGDLQITGIDGMTGDVTVESVPAGTTAPFPLASGTRQSFDVVLTPSAPGDRGAFLMITSDDPDHPSVEVKVTGFGVAAGAPRLSVRAFLEFGVVQVVAPATLDLELRNIGDGPLQIDTLAPDPHGSPAFTLPAPPALPLPIPPGGSTTVPVQFAPTANGVVRGALTIAGSGQGQVVTLTGQGTTTAAGLVAALFEQFGIGQPADAIV
jgi:hypothetical protein